MKHPLEGAGGHYPTNRWYDTPRKIFIFILLFNAIDTCVSIYYNMDMTSNYYMMYNLYLNGRITEGEWYTYCTELLFTMPEFIGVITRLRMT